MVIYGMQYLFINTPIWKGNSTRSMPQKKKILVIYHNPDSFQNTRMTIIHHLKALEYVGENNDIIYHNVNDVFQDFMANGKQTKPLSRNPIWNSAKK